MNNTLLSISKNDMEHVAVMSKRAFDDIHLEFETRIIRPLTTSSNFLNVRELCRKKTCTNSWRCIKEREKTLDIGIGVYRITICGLHYIQQYVQDENLENLPLESWNVIKKKTVDDYKKGHIINELGLKLNLKEEISIEKNNPEFAILLSEWDTHKKKFRLKNRYSFLVDEMYCVDLTVVKAGALLLLEKTLKKSRTLQAPETYEIELEYVPNIIPNEKKNFDLNKWENILNEILCSFQDTKIVSNVTSSHIEKEYYSFLSKKNINKVSKTIKTTYKLSPNVVSLTMDRLKILKEDAKNCEKYFVTPKSDGLRMTGYICETGELFLFGNKSQYFQFTGIIFNKACAKTILDGELIMKTKQNQDIYDFLIFDCYFFKGEDIRTLELVNRQEHGEKLLAEISSRGELLNGIKCKLVVKQFFPLTKETFDNKCQECFESISNGIYENDGLIFTPKDKVGGDILYKDKTKTGFIKSGVNFDRLLKWKNSKFNSIDFRIEFQTIIEKPIKIDNDFVLIKFQKCVLKIGDNENKKVTSYTRNNFVEDISTKNKKHFKRFETIFQPTEPVDEKAHCVNLPIIDNKVCCKIGDEWSGVTINSNDIIEMIYDTEAGAEYHWIPIRVRKDKTEPNFITNALDVWRSIHFPITESMLVGTENIPDIENEIYYNNRSHTDNNLRMFHRLGIKDMLFQESITKSDSKRLLDIGSGKGGDIPRYLEYDATVIGIDNSIDNLHNSNDGAYKRLSDRIKKEKLRLPADKIIFLAGDGGELFSDSNTFIQNGNDSYKKLVEENAIFKNPHTFDTASVFFVIHYFFKSKRIFQNFLKNIADNVKIGGYFVGCCYDGNIIHQKLKETQNNTLSFKNSDGDIILEINKDYDGDFDDTENSLGKTINVLVQSINKKHSEYLVNFNFLTKELFKIGFRTVHTYNFEHIYNNNPNHKSKYKLSEGGEKNASFLNRTFIFERFSYDTEEISIN